MIPTSESLHVELKSGRKRLPDAELVDALVCLAKTACDLTASAKDLCHHGSPLPYGPDRRAQLRAELYAHYARHCGLTRDQQRYILDPANVMGDDNPSETFRVLKNSELREFGEYRTQRLVPGAWDRLTQTGDLH